MCLETSEATSSGTASPGSSALQDQAALLASRNERPSQSNESKLAPGKLAAFGEYIDLISRMVSLITWPLVLVVVLAMFYSPLRRIADVLPEKFERSNEISVGALSLKIQEQARASGNEELAFIIKGLSQSAIEWLLKIGDGIHRVIGSDDGDDGITKNYILNDNIGVWKELEEKGLLKSDVGLKEYERYFKSLNPEDNKVPKTSLSPSQEDKLLKNSVELTESGKRAYKIIIGVVADMIGNKSQGADNKYQSK